MTIGAMLMAGALGAWLRYEISIWIQTRCGSALPLGTSAVNILGTVVLALLVALHRKDAISNEIVFVMGVGFSGAFTTFSTWMVETGRMLEAGGGMRHGIAAVNIVGQLVAALLAAVVVLAIV